MHPTEVDRGRATSFFSVAIGKGFKGTKNGNRQRQRKSRYQQVEENLNMTKEDTDKSDHFGEVS